ncbi:hypothetical protein HDU96_001370 [Phlyctochytrium bullatum]|nr:hypothetical protein HDU96_001370 [Phlyctochytrium bullatum]
MPKLTLFQSPTSPFVRKVLVLARELGVFTSLELKDGVVLPTMIESNVSQNGNPLGKIPTLVVDETPLFGSQVICQYLLEGHSVDPAVTQTFLPPSTSPHRFAVLTLETLGDGMCEAALLARYETALRPEQYRWEDWTNGQLAKITRALNELEKRLEKNEGKGFLGTSEGVTLGDISVGCALGYLDFRYSHWPWRPTRPLLEKWFEKFSTRPAFVATAPPK